MNSINENTEVKLDLKTIAIICGGVLSVASTYFTLQGKIDELNNKIENFSGEEFVQKNGVSAKRRVSKIYNNSNREIY